MISIGSPIHVRTQNIPVRKSRLVRCITRTSTVEATRRIKHINLMVPEPVFVDTDDYGVYEFVIEFELFVGKENENHA